MIASNMSTFSEAHIDAAGYCTTMKILAGSKLWFLQCKKLSKSPSSYMPKYQHNWSIEDSSWCAAHLSAGDILYDISPLSSITLLTSLRYMHPESPHVVLTTKSCIAIGTHFYCIATTRETFFAMVAEHFNGRFITNVEHPRAPILYLKAVDAIFSAFTCIYGADCKKLPQKWHSLCFPSLLHLARSLPLQIHYPRPMILFGLFF